MMQPSANMAKSSDENDLSQNETQKVELSKVLIVDDEFTFRSVLEEVLSDDHEVTCAESGEDTLALLNTGLRYSVIISDILMPQMNGIELYHRIVQLDPKQADRMVFMTGGTFGSDMQSFIETVKNKKIVKPFRLKELRALMASITSK